MHVESPLSQPQVFSLVQVAVQQGPAIMGLTALLTLPKQLAAVHPELLTC